MLRQELRIALPSLSIRISNRNSNSNAGIIILGRFATGKFGKEASRIFDGEDPSCGLKKAHWDDVYDLLQIVYSMRSFDVIPDNGTQLKKIRGSKNTWQIRVTREYRIIFDWINGQAENIKFGYFKNTNRMWINSIIMI